jgi:hypothetical protein
VISETKRFSEIRVNFFSGGTLLTGGSDGVVRGGSGPIWLDGVKCFGNETRIQDCVHKPWGSNNCEHYQDVSVLCHSFQGTVV